MGRAYLPDSQQGFEFFVNNASTVQSFPVTPGACEFFLAIDASNVPSARRNSPAYPGRNEVINVFLEIVADDDEVIVSIKPRTYRTRVSLSQKQCESIDLTRKYYVQNPGLGTPAIEWRLWCPLGLTVSLYRKPIKCVTQFWP